MTPDAMATFAALFLAHVLADYVFQTAGMVAAKRQAGVLALHTAIVVATAQLAIGRVDSWVPLAIGGVHLVVDIIKTRLPPTLTAHLADQAAHVATIAVAAALVPDLFAGGAWPPFSATLMMLLGAAIYATRAGGFAVAHLMARFDSPALPETLPAGGFWIGVLERGIIFMFVIVGEPAGIGFLIAAKSILRFDTVRGEQKAAEYVIIGTLASFGWAMAVAWGTSAALGHLPPLGFAAL